MRFFLIIILVLTLLATVLSGCQTDSTTAPSKQVVTGDVAALEPNTATMWVHGMACPQCANNVDLQLLKVPGVQSVKVDMGSGKVVARLSPDNPPTKEQLSTAIDNTGFTLKRIEMR